MTERQYIESILHGHRLYWDTLGKMRGNDNHKGDVCWLSGDINYSYSVQLSGQNYDGQIKSIIQRIINKEIPGNIVILPDSAPDAVDVIDLFEKTNLFKIDYISLGMAKILCTGIESLKADKKLNIYRITDLYQLKMSGAIFNAAFEYDLFSYEHYLDAFNMQEVCFYIAEFCGLPVGACMTISENEILEIAWVAVLPGYRKKGIAGNLISMAERDAIKNGKSISVLTAFEKAINAYKRVGYKAYCKVIVISFTGKDRDL